MTSLPMLKQEREKARVAFSPFAGKQRTGERGGGYSSKLTSSQSPRLIGPDGRERERERERVE